MKRNYAMRCSAVLTALLMFVNNASASEAIPEIILRYSGSIALSINFYLQTGMWVYFGVIV